jgi:DNA-binding CsgD family transcriptional regulator/tetratricopeptide (TPR) repeat protein
VRERRTPTRLVGRNGELARLRQLADDGDVGAVLLTGPTGIGKSRLADGVLDDLTTTGWHGFGLAATDPASRIPYGALSELIGDTLDGLDDLSTPSAELTVLRSVEEALGLDHVDRRVAVAVHNVAVIDDPTCDLLVHLAANRRLFIIADQGPDRDVDAAIRRLAPAGLVEHNVGPLSPAAVAELAADILGGPVGPGLVRNLYDRTQGSPLFACELLAAARANGGVGRVDGVHQLTADLELKPSMARQILIRLGLLSQSEQDVVELLSLAGELGVEDLCTVTEPHVLETMERRGLIVTRTAGRRLRAAHAHPLHAEAVKANMTPLVHRRRHRELADVLEATGLRRAEDQVAGALARLSAGRAVPIEQRLAGVKLALRLDRIRDGAELARSAHLEEQSERTRTALADTLIRLGRFVEADGLLAEPLDDRGDEWLRLRRAILRSSNRLWGFRDSEGALHIDDLCLATLTEPDAVARVESHQAWIDYCDGRPVDALNRIEHLAIDDAVADVRYALAAVRAPSLVCIGRVVDGERLAQRAWDEGWGTDTEYGSHGQHLIALGYAKLYQGDIEAARLVAEMAIAHCRSSSETTGLLFFLDLAANVELLAGDLPTAVAHLEEALTIGSDLAIATSVRSSLATLAAARGQLGQPDEAGNAWHRFLTVPPAPSPRGVFEERRGEAWVRAGMGDGPAAAEILGQAAADCADRGLLVYQLLLLFDRARLGYADTKDRDAAATSAERCQGSLASVLVEAIGAFVSGDGTALDDGAERMMVMGLPLWGAELSARAADAWASSGQQRAATASQRLSDQRRAQLPQAATPGLAPTRSVEPLTRREREIATVAAGGASNLEIAEALHISVRTVETHLHRIYRKLGITSRADLADALGPGGAAG